ncbi:flagellar export chaperone FliS [Agromyces sp. G08B096]|uniref:Flagellar export chaperone FliS n=1 Tax=Agromyces sp. G08B096 TaxID=3156399 RepID=A0AAU7W7E8_9MICO
MIDRSAEYRRTAILSASPSRLLTMLYDRLLLDLHRAEAAQLAGDWPEAGGQLTHAQDIVIELQRSLDVDLWDGASRLMAIYDYVFQALVRANIGRDVELTRECIARLEPLRRAWHEAAEASPARSTTGAAHVG